MPAGTWVCGTASEQSALIRYIDLDFETASAADLKLVGADAYAQDPTTEILCLVYQVNDEGCAQWYPGQSTQFLTEWVKDPETIFVAHHAGFEQAIWRWLMVKDFGFPEIPIERWEDTMAMCAWKAYPLKLEKAAKAAGLPIEKDMEGNRLTLSMSRVNKKTGMYPARTPGILARITDYCAQDVAVESALRRKIGLLSQQSLHERRVWLLDQKINQRGVRLDMEFVAAAQRVVDRATVPLLAEFRDLTGGINPGQIAKVVEWAGGQGVQLDNLQKGYLAGLLGEEEIDDDGYESLADEDMSVQDKQASQLPAHVGRVLRIRQMLGSASIKKLARMRACVGLNGRAHGLLQYHAAITGRWGGRLLQPQNFPRGTFNPVFKISPEMAVDAIMSGDPEYVEMVLGCPAIEAVASSLRHALVPDPGKLFLVGDFAGIEARIVLALAGQHDKVAMMASGQDVYLDMARDIYGRVVTKADIEMRQTGKNSVLGCGFQMGAPKFHARYCKNQPIEFAENVIYTYRKVWAPEVPKLWYALEAASTRAVKEGTSQETYGVLYQREDDWLTATLPSGWQKLWYPAPRLFHDEKFNKEAWQYTTSKGGKTSQAKAFGGLETEHVVSGLARGLLVASMMRIEREGMPIVLTVHDEIVAEVDEDRADLARFEHLMAEPTPWSERIEVPISVETWQGKRYKK